MCAYRKTQYSHNGLMPAPDSAEGKLCLGLLKGHVLGELFLAMSRD